MRKTPCGVLSDAHPSLKDHVQSEIDFCLGDLESALEDIRFQHDMLKATIGYVLFGANPEEKFRPYVLGDRAE